MMTFQGWKKRLTTLAGGALLSPARLVLPLLLPALLTACNQVAPSAPPQAEPVPDVVPLPPGLASVPVKGQDFIAYSTTPCFGFCPVFDAVLLADGTEYFNGHQHAAQQGLTRRQLDPAVFRQASQILQQTDFFTLPGNITNHSEDGSGPAEVCQHYRTDGPSVQISARSGQLSKSVDYYTGCSSNSITDRAALASEQLRQILRLDELAVSKR